MISGAFTQKSFYEIVKEINNLVMLMIKIKIAFFLIIFMPTVAESAREQILKCSTKKRDLKSNRKAKQIGRKVYRDLINKKRIDYLDNPKLNVKKHSCDQLAHPKLKRLAESQSSNKVLPENLKNSSNTENQLKSKSMNLKDWEELYHTITSQEHLHVSLDQRFSELFKKTAESSLKTIRKLQDQSPSDVLDYWNNYKNRYNDVSQYYKSLKYKSFILSASILEKHRKFYKNKMKKLLQKKTEIGRYVHNMCRLTFIINRSGDLKVRAKAIQHIALYRNQLDLNPIFSIFNQKKSQDILALYPGIQNKLNVMKECSILPFYIAQNTPYGWSQRDSKTLEKQNTSLKHVKRICKKIFDADARNIRPQNKDIKEAQRIYHLITRAIKSDEWVKKARNILNEE